MDIFCTALCLKNLKISLLSLIYALKCITNFKNQTKNWDEKISSLTMRKSNPQSCSLYSVYSVHTPQSTEHFGTTGQK